MLIPAPAILACSFRSTDFIDRAAVNAHPHPQFGMTFEFPANLDRAEDRRFRAGAENERATVTSGQAEQFTFPFSQAELLRAAHDLFQCLKLLALLGDEQFGITDDVDEENVPDLELDLFFNLRGHINAPTGITRMIYNLDSTADSREQSPPSRYRGALQRQLAHLHSIRLFLPDHRPRSSTERTRVS